MRVQLIWHLGWTDRQLGKHSDRAKATKSVMATMNANAIAPRTAATSSSIVGDTKNQSTAKRDRATHYRRLACRRHPYLCTLIQDCFNVALHLLKFLAVLRYPRFFSFALF